MLRPSESSRSVGRPYSQKASENPFVCLCASAQCRPWDQHWHTSPCHSALPPASGAAHTNTQQYNNNNNNNNNVSTHNTKHNVQMWLVNITLRMMMHVTKFNPELITCSSLLVPHASPFQRDTDTTLWGKKTAPFYFCNNFVKSFFVCIITDTHIP